MRRLPSFIRAPKVQDVLQLVHRGATEPEDHNGGRCHERLVVHRIERTVFHAPSVHGARRHVVVTHRLAKSRSERAARPHDRSIRVHVFLHPLHRHVPKVGRLAIRVFEPQVHVLQAYRRHGLPHPRARQRLPGPVAEICIAHLGRLLHQRVKEGVPAGVCRPRARRAGARAGEAATIVRVVVHEIARVGAQTAALQRWVPFRQGTLTAEGAGQRKLHSAESPEELPDKHHWVFASANGSSWAGPIG
mmetsp:Transcript_29386/g.69355  ORF Transcript_29386/g.69355 Transcript_29386/m.69355 type:complete len:247 (+) Transcript_29386:411-1151(+)